VSRDITTHHGDPLNDALVVTAFDPVGGGPCCEYAVAVPRKAGVQVHGLTFHHGDPTAEVTGLTSEALLAVLIDRLTRFQLAALGCQENAAALQALRRAEAALKTRTANRAAGIVL